MQYQNMSVCNASVDQSHLQCDERGVQNASIMITSNNFESSFLVNENARNPLTKIQGIKILRAIKPKPSQLLNVSA